MRSSKYCTDVKYSVQNVKWIFIERRKKMFWHSISKCLHVCVVFFVFGFIDLYVYLISSPPRSPRWILSDKVDSFLCVLFPLFLPLRPHRKWNTNLLSTYRSFVTRALFLFFIHTICSKRKLRNALHKKKEKSIAWDFVKRSTESDCNREWREWEETEQDTESHEILYVIVIITCKCTRDPHVTCVSEFMKNW